MHDAPRLAIIGAGVSGLIAANEAQRQGLICSVFDKARRAGGRLASRRSDWGSFNHGAAYFSMPSSLTQTGDPRLQRMLSQDLSTVLLATIDGEKCPALVPSDSINAIAQTWTQGLSCTYQHTLTELKHDGHNWWLKFSENVAWVGPFDRVLMTCPPAQALALLAKSPAQYSLCKRLQQMQHAPCWSLRWVPMQVPMDSVFVRDDLQAHGIALCIREDLRPQGHGVPRFSVHATPAWSAQHLELDSDAAAQLLMRAAAQALGIASEAQYLEAHRWRYASVIQAAGEPHLVGANGLFYGGDACLGGTVAQAMLSGLSAADAICADVAVPA